MDVVRELPHLTFYRGRVAMYAILKALGVGKGDQVLTQAFTCLAVPEGIMATGASPVFVDTEEGGVNMCPTDLASKLGPQVKAVILQHTFGIPAQIVSIKEALAGSRLPLVEDCCHTFASTYVNQLVGTFGVGAFYSFEWGKPIIAGLGGSAVLNDRDLRQRVESIWHTTSEPPFVSVLKVQLMYAAFNRLYSPSSFWKTRRRFRALSKSGVAEGNYHATEGVSEEFGYRMSAPLRKRLRAKLVEAGQLVERAREIVAKYESAPLSQRLKRPLVPEGAVPVYARWPLFAEDKERLLAIAEESNVEIADWYTTPIHPLSAADWKQVGYEPGSCPRAESLSAQIVSLPVNQKVNQSDIDRAMELLRDL
ncbi:MAG: DegT/DnrJ/EryC1/StrS family aminotransferase [Armatimonadetes bacterium]|nr:DegT/DnrJ/EryC1/StrS family aminotransferase [Armatimonadota bacterium]